MIKSLSQFFKRLFDFCMPPPEWRFSVLLLLGIFVGLGFYVFYISNAVSYLSEDPRACINCHVMSMEYATWQRSSHARVASCVDCHVPHDNVLNKYYFKLKDGTRHAAIFTMRAEPQVIQIKEEAVKTVQQNCIRCHMGTIHNVSISYLNQDGHDAQRLCWDCHRETPHGRVRSLSALPQARVPRMQQVVPDWLEELFISNQ